MSRNLLFFFEGALFIAQLIFVQIVWSCAIFTAWSRACGPDFVSDRISRMEHSATACSYRISVIYFLLKIIPMFDGTTAKRVCSRRQFILAIFKVGRGMATNYNQLFGGFDVDCPGARCARDIQFP
jgi:hypothetical protein